MKYFIVSMCLAILCCAGCGSAPSIEQAAEVDQPEDPTPIDIDNPSYKGACGGQVTDANGEKQPPCASTDRPVCYEDGSCTCKPFDECPGESDENQDVPS